jgi:glycerophosphoryl diester phosphodiesterase
MKIIGHRGAAGLALENTIESIKEGVSAKADYIEIDVRETNDQKLVLSHDENLKRTYGVDLKIKDHRLQDLRIPCPNLPLLETALKACKTEGIIVELKEYVDPKLIFAEIEKFPDLDIRIASFNHHVIREIKKQRPDLFCYVLEHHSPFEIINHAKAMKADGIGLNYSMINPLTYLLARRAKLHIYVYTLNKPWIARGLKWLYRDIYICSDYPNLLRELRN